MRRYLYMPQVPTTVFTGNDFYGNPLIFRVGLDSVSFWLNGVKLLDEMDYNATANTVTLVQAPVTAPSTVELVVLADNRPTYPPTTVKINTAVWNVNGVDTQYPLVDLNNVPLLVVSPTDIILSVDGICQEAYIDYTLISTATETDIIFAAPPQPDQTIWGVAGIPVGGGGGGSVFYSDTPPPGPVNGTLWVNFSAEMFIWDAAAANWRQIAGQSN